jgi:hypothetical protein
MRPPKFFLILSYQKIHPLYNWNFPNFDIAKNYILIVLIIRKPYFPTDID